MITYQYLLSTVDSDTPTGACCVALDDGVLVASCGVSLRADIAHINALFVANTHRGRGIGKELLKLAATIASSQGKEQITLTVHRNNTSARYMYFGLGFRIVGVGVTPDYLLMKAFIPNITAV